MKLLMDCAILTFIKKPLDKEGNPSEEEALLELYRKLRPGEPPTVSGGQQLLESRFFDPNATI